MSQVEPMIALSTLALFRGGVSVSFGRVGPAPVREDLHRAHKTAEATRSSCGVFFPCGFFFSSTIVISQCTLHRVSSPVVFREVCVMWSLWTVMKSCEFWSDESPRLSLKLTAIHAVM